MVTAKAFGMKVTRYFVGFGPTLWSFRKGETEYGVKAHPARRLRQDRRDDAAGRRRRAGRRAAGDVALPGVEADDRHVRRLDHPLRCSAFVILWGLFAFVAAAGRRQDQRVGPRGRHRPARASGSTGRSTRRPGSRRPASTARTRPAPPPPWACRPGDKIIAVNGEPVPTWTAMTEKIRAAGGQQVTLTYVRDGQTDHVRPGHDPGRAAAQGGHRPDDDGEPGHPGQAGAGRPARHHPGRRDDDRRPDRRVRPGQGPDRGRCSRARSPALKKFPEKVPRLWARDQR